MKIGIKKFIIFLLVIIGGFFVNSLSINTRNDLTAATMVDNTKSHVSPVFPQNVREYRRYRYNTVVQQNRPRVRAAQRAPDEHAAYARTKLGLSKANAPEARLKLSVEDFNVSFRNFYSNLQGDYEIDKVQWENVDEKTMTTFHNVREFGTFLNGIYDKINGEGGIACKSLHNNQQQENFSTLLAMISNDEIKKQYLEIYRDVAYKKPVTKDSSPIDMLLSKTFTDITDMMVALLRILAVVGEKLEYGRVSFIRTLQNELCKISSFEICGNELMEIRKAYITRAMKKIICLRLNFKTMQL